MTHEVQNSSSINTVKQACFCQKESSCCGMLVCYSTCINVCLSKKHIENKQRLWNPTNLLSGYEKAHCLPLNWHAYMKWIDSSFFILWNSYVNNSYSLDMEAHLFFFFNSSFGCSPHNHVIKNHWTRVKKNYYIISLTLFQS